MLLSGPPQYILSDNELKFDCNAVQDFARRFNIHLKCASTYNPQGNGVVEGMKALKKGTRNESKEWNASLENITHGYRRIPGANGVAPFEIVFGVKSRSPTETTGAIPGEEL